nr:Crp/Fnr family transcriptional regulator [Propionibacterium sp.]
MAAGGASAGRSAPVLSLADRRTLLASPFGRGLGPRDLAVMWGVDLGTGEPDGAAPCVRMAHRSRGKTLAWAGQPQTTFFVLLAGRLEVVRHRADGARRVLDVVGPGSVCGAVTAFAPDPRWPADVEAAEDVRLLIVSVPLLVAEGATDPTRQRLLRNMLGVLAERARHLHARGELLARRGLRERLSFWLVHNADPAGRVAGVLTRQGLADHLGVSRASMTRELGRMADEGLIAVRGRSFEILDAEALRRLAG